MATNKLSRVEIVRRCKPVILWIGLVAGVGLVAVLKKHRLNTLQKESAMATNRPSRIESMRRYKPIILWICLVAITISLSILVIISDTGWNWGNLMFPVILFILVLFFTLITLGYIFKWNWIGVSRYTPDKEYQRGKTLWDWLQLLLIPLFIAGGGWLFNIQQEQRNQQAIKQQHDTDTQNANNQRQNDILKTYLDNMSDLVVKYNLRDSKDGDSVRDVARGQTLVAIQRLNTGDEKDNMLKGRLLQLLHETRLIKRDNRVISLQYAHLDGADMNGPNVRFLNTNLDLIGDNLSVLGLNDANLRAVFLINADLHNTGLNGTHLNGAVLAGANLSNAFMKHTDLSGANLCCSVDYDSPNFSIISIGANLNDADLGGAKLSGADLRGAKLSGANLDGADLHGTEYNTKVMQEKDEQGKPVTDEQGKPVMIDPTQWPQGFDPDAHGAICVDYEKS